jgi:hypothetical protein
MFGSPNRTGAWLNFAQRSRDEGGLGLAPHQAAGLVGNLVNESGPDLNPWGPSGDNGTAWGTAQWRGDRLAGLQDYARKNGLDHRSMEAQQGWMRQEFDGPEAKAYAALTAATTPEEAASAVNQHYERSADTSGNRERAARELMTQFGSDDTSPGALTSSFAPTEKKKSMPAALSTDNTMGPGILNMNGADGGDDPVARGLVGLGSALAGISNPEQGKALAALQANMAKVPGNKWTVAHVDPKTGQAMLTNGTSFVPTNFFKPKPDEDEYDKAAKIAAAKSNQELGDNINQAARDAANTGSTIAEARAALSDPHLKQGIDGPARQMLNKVYTAFGFGDPATAANGDVASALSNKLALQMVNAGGTKLLPGSFSDSDRKFVEKMSSSLSNTPEANQRLLDIFERANKHVLEAEALRAAHVEKNDGIIRPSFKQELAELSAKHLKADQDAAAARTTAPAAMTAQKPVNTFTAKNGKTINWSY